MNELLEILSETLSQKKLDDIDFERGSFGYILKNLKLKTYLANRLVYGKNVKFNYQFWMGIFYKQRKPSSALVDAFSKCFDLNFAFRNYDSVTFTCGYPKKDDKERRITFKNPHIRISEGKTEWGAKAGRKYFVISWEDRI